MARVAIQLAATLSALAMALGCRGGGHSEERPPSRPEQREVEASEKPKPTKAANPAPELSVDGKHELPVKFPAAKPEFAIGQRALAVPQNWLDNALELGVDRQVVSLYDARVVALGPEKSEVKSASGALWTLPNAVIIALPTEAKVKAGDVVLTHWPQGGSWMRAVVVDAGGDATKARLLDVPIDEPAGWGTRALELERGSFLPLTKPGQSGTTAACKQGTSWRRLLVIRSDEESILGLGFAGKLLSLPKADCRLLPLARKIATGASVMVPWGNKYVKATVRSEIVEGGRAPATPDKKAPAQAEAKDGDAPPTSKAKGDASAPAGPPPGRVRVELQVPPRVTLEVPQLDVALDLPE